MSKSKEVLVQVAGHLLGTDLAVHRPPEQNEKYRQSVVPDIHHAVPSEGLLRT